MTEQFSADVTEVSLSHPFLSSRQVLSVLLSVKESFLFFLIPDVSFDGFGFISFFPVSIIRFRFSPLFRRDKTCLVSLRDFPISLLSDLRVSAWDETEGIEDVSMLPTVEVVD